MTAVRSRADRRSDAGAGRRRHLVFHTYEQLPVKGNARLLRLHTSAGTTIDRSATGYFRHMPATLLW